MRKLLLAIDADPAWYPGKNTGAPPGRKRTLSTHARATIKRSAEALKATSLEPTYPMLLARCPKATRNLATGEPVQQPAGREAILGGKGDQPGRNAWPGPLPP